MSTQQYLNKMDATTYETATFKSESIKTMVKNRNKLLLDFGNMCYDVLSKLTEDEEIIFTEKTKYGESTNVRLIGNPHQPSLVINNSFVMSVFVKNFNIYFSDAFKDGDVFGSIDLNLASDEDNKQHVIDILLENNTLDKLEKKQLYKVVTTDDSMFFSSFDARGNVYFSKTNPQLFFDYAQATEVCYKLKENGYDVYVNDPSMPF